MTKRTRDTLKRLNSMRADLEAEIDALMISKKNIQEEIYAKRGNLNRLRQQINELKRSGKELTVSEHAIIRYMERVMGANMDHFVEKILPPDELPIIQTLGNGTYPVNNGEFRILIKDGVVVTVLNDTD